MSELAPGAGSESSQSGAGAQNQENRLPERSRSPKVRNSGARAEPEPDFCYPGSRGAPALLEARASAPSV